MSVKNLGASCAIVGGGYAGLAVAIELKRRAPHIQVTLFDERAQHQKITQWHKLVRGKKASQYEVNFQTLSRRFHFTFIQKKIHLTALLQNPKSALYQKFDAVVLAQGSHSPMTPANVVTLDTLRNDTAEQEHLRTLDSKKIAVIGGGPTGVQFAFELAARKNQVLLFEAQERLLPSFDASLGETAVAEAARAKIDLHLNTEFLRFENNTLYARSGSESLRFNADYVLFVPGVRSTPAFNCDSYGRILEIQGKAPHTRFYAVGDNSYFSGRGLNSKSAQAAIRKAQQVAETLRADLQGGNVPEYTYQELGYFVSLGPKSAVGYLFSQKTAFAGRAALLMKEAVERQYDLYLAGFNVYL
ncbi:MAG TPA: FAD-dependent oxidoreductase [Turneriella sp.]|nr:FAD-dependent oxidoreductase [Turneriella sp.]